MYYNFSTIDNSKNTWIFINSEQNSSTSQYSVHTALSDVKFKNIQAILLADHVL